MKSLANTNLSFICGNVNFSIPENALADTFRYRIPYVSSPRRKFERFKINNSFVRVARHPPCDANGWHGRNDIQISVAKYLGGGENNQRFASARLEVSSDAIEAAAILSSVSMFKFWLFKFIVFFAPFLFVRLFLCR